MNKNLIIAVTLFLSVKTFAQNPLQYKDEVNQLTSADASISKKDIILFTGSSSIRLWQDLATRFPNKNVLNRGFGGSEMADLNYYFEQLILPYNPKQIFIYEGDNDLNSGRDVKFILAYADTLLKKIRAYFPLINVAFISAKPSVARWKLHDKYEAFNKQLSQWTKKQHNVSFVDIWPPMLDEKGNPKKELFMPDSLHMNSKGYDIWTKVIEKKIQ